MTDQSGANEISNQGGQIRRNRRHSISKILGELCTVSGDGDDLVAESMNVVDVGVGDFGAHGYFGSSFEGSFEVFREDRREICRGGVCSEAHGLDDLGVC